MRGRPTCAAATTRTSATNGRSDRHTRRQPITLAPVPATVAPSLPCHSPAETRRLASHTIAIRTAVRRAATVRGTSVELRSPQNEAMRAGSPSAGDSEQRMARPASASRMTSEGLSMDARSLHPRAFPAALTLPAGVHFGGIGPVVSFPIALAAGSAAASCPMAAASVPACLPMPAANFDAATLFN